jgi:hypothetical protein
MKTYTDAELNQLVAEVSDELDTIFKNEAVRAPLAKSVDMAKADDKSPDEASESASAAPAESAPAESAPAPEAPPADAASAAPADASASAPADPAASADPAAGASGTDSLAALQAAYSQLSPDELAMHEQALAAAKQALLAASAGPAAGAPAPAAVAAPGPDATAPLASEGSKPVDPMSTLALKSEFEGQLTLVKSERDAEKAKVEQLEKNLAALADTMEKFIMRPERKSLTGKDMAVIMKSEQSAPASVTLTKDQVTKKLLTVARDPELKKSDRELINKYYKGDVKVDALAHLLQ